MAKKSKIIKALAVAGLVAAPAASVYANTLHVSVTVASVASIAEVIEEEDNDGKVVTAVVSTNSTNGYDLYVSADDHTWTKIKSVDHYPTGDELRASVRINGGEVKFKAEPRE